jgi:Cu/Ag efflux protein CusF
MTRSQVIARTAAAALLVAASACSGTGGLGNVLGSVLSQGQQQGSQVSGYIQGVDTRSQQVYIQQPNGQTLALSYDNNTQVVYQNQRYNVANLERGDQVTARVQSTNNGAYYTDYVQVDRSASSSAGSTQNVQTLQGTVRQVDLNNGLFTLDVQNGGRITVQLPSQVSRADFDRFRNLRPGDYTRFTGVYLGNGRAELRQFY